MVDDDSSRSDHACDGVQGMEALRTGLQTQDVVLRVLAKSVD